MPSSRKRIGYLPSEEVADIIEKICIKNKFSQSKVTGILVEEALRSRGLLKNLLSNFSNQDIGFLEDIKKNNFFQDINLINNFNYSNLNKRNFKNDLNMINEFIEFKFFKEVMSENNIKD